jgi:hypothetical protein
MPDQPPFDGVRRLRLTARLLLFAGVPAAVVLWVCAWLTAGLGLKELAVLAGTPLVAGGLLWWFAWILEGFLSTGANLKQ